MAVALIDSNHRAPQIEKLVATESNLCEGFQTVRIDVYVKYQGQVTKSNSYLFPYNQEDCEAANFMYDNKQEKTGFTKAAQTINTQVS